MKYDEIAQLRTHHPAWVLLRSNNVALVLSVLGRVYVDGRRLASARFRARGPLLAGPVLLVADAAGGIRVH